MLYTYKECIKKYKSYYYFNLALKNKALIKINDGLYSDTNNINLLEAFVKKYKNTVFTMESAFYYLEISDVIPDKYTIVTCKDDTKYKSECIKQYFDNSKAAKIGIVTTRFNGVNINVYCKERLLLEAIRYKNKLSLDYYKDIIRYYRNHINEMDFSKIDEYLKIVPKRKFITNILQNEVL